MERIPVTILTGFLGSGKTTLLNQIISHNKDKKIAIIENEFGEISIDSELVIKTDNGIFELSNGCICCSLNGDLLEVLMNITNNYPQTEHLIIETTGIADPAPIALCFLSDYKIQTTFRLDSIITLVDAQNIEQQLENENIASKQIAIADVVLINKCDLVDAYKKDVVNNIVTRINPQAQVILTEKGTNIGLNLLDLQSFSANAVLKTNFEKQSIPNKEKKFKISTSSTTGNTNLLGKKEHQHTHVGSVSFILDQPLDVLKFDAWIRIMLNWGNSIFYRAKGILYIENFDQKVIFQSVQNQYVTESGGPWGDDKKQTKIVFIGKYLDRDLLEQGLKSCLVNDILANDEEFFTGIMDIQDKMYDKIFNKES
jgi:G3E family GTPase